MSQITLKPLDDGQKAVEIPFGKTTIGRGPLLGCSDKKVSRNHAVLEVTSEGEVFLTPTHVNPCFLKPTDDNPGQILKKDVPCKLENGDTFSLLPKAYRYQLIIGNDSSQNESCSQEEDVKHVGKTNGSALDENNAANEEHDVAGKVLSKEEISAAEKNSSLDENSYSKKLPENKDNGETNFAKDKEENSSSEPLKKDSPEEEINLSVSEIPVLTVKEKENVTAKNCGKEEISESRENNSCSEVCVDAENKSVEVEKVIEDENCELKEDLQNTDEQGKSENPVADENTCVSQPVEPVVADSVAESSSEIMESEVKGKEEVSSLLTKKESTAQMTKPKKERQATKRKAAAVETFSKSKGRKKALKMNFDDAKEGTSRQPGRTSSRTNRQTRQGLSLEDFIVSDDDEWQSDHSEHKQRRRKRGRKGGGGEDSGSDWEVDHKKPKKSLLKGWSGSESGSEQSTQKRKKGVKNRRKKEEDDDDLNEVVSEDPSSSAAIKLKTRIPCSYGKKCFRRNASHKEQFSHPGDTDYVSETEVKPKSNDAISESEDEAPKKECPYGANCFRKNPQHKKDFKHTKNVRPQREAAKQADKKAKNSRSSSDGIDSYDLNDSFLNDDSADEYKPVDSGSDYESGEKLKKHTKVKGNRSKRGKKL